jgi:hypothetical protein
VLDDKKRLNSDLQKVIPSSSITTSTQSISDKIQDFTHQSRDITSKKIQVPQLYVNIPSGSVPAQPKISIDNLKKDLLSWLSKAVMK